MLRQSAGTEMTLTVDMTTSSKSLKENFNLMFLKS